MDVYDRLKELNLTLPPAPPLGGTYKKVVQEGNCLYASGQVPIINGEWAFTGRVGSERTIEEAQEAARNCVLNVLSSLHHSLGDLNKIKGVIKTIGFVRCAENFDQLGPVTDAASNLLKDIWGEDGVGVRSSIGVYQLPRGVCVEFEFIFKI